MQIPKQLLTVFRSLRITHRHWQNEGVLGNKIYLDIFSYMFVVHPTSCPEIRMHHNRYTLLIA
jgi:hypothetical protein